MIFDFNKGFDNQCVELGVRRPLIAISANVIDENSALHKAYCKAIINAGGAPLIVPHVCEYAALKAIMMNVDGVLFSGGADVDAHYFGGQDLGELTECNAERDYHEFMLLRMAINCGVPIFGICRGFQLINIALGGDIYQDLPSEYPVAPLNHSVLTNKHLGVHDVQIEQGSLLHKILQTTNISVNSRHHQGLKDIAPSLKVVALSSDNLVEAVEAYPNHKIIAVQWHPENMAADGDNAAMKRLFEFFVAEARLYAQAKRIHNIFPVVDSHCDTPMLYAKGGFDLSRRNSEAKVDIIKMEEGFVDATITVAYIPQSTPAHQAYDKAIGILNRFVEDVSKHGDSMVVVRDVEQLLDAKSRGLKSVMLGIENGLALGDNLDNLDVFKELGVVYITLCHNGSNAICDSAAGEKPFGGLSEFGRKVIARMNYLGITVDISHSSEQTTMQAVALSKQPIIASHSSCKALCDHRRNLSDEAIVAIAKAGGVVQICGYGGFLASDREATVHDIVSHIEHAVSLVGYNHVGIGSDFDGDGGVIGFDGANEFTCLTVELLRKGHKQDDIAKIMGGNILRVLSQNLK
ncbi:MAG: membrane dipeptidase [Rikenellaceae bacterium]